MSLTREPTQVDTSVQSAAPRKKRWFVKTIAVIISPILVWVTVDLGGSLLPPSQDSYVARTAEWVRYRGMGAIVNTLEEWVYEISPPKEGGEVVGGIPYTAEIEDQASHKIESRPVEKPPRGVPAPKAMKPYSAPAIDNEGKWQTLAVVDKEPAIRVAYIRPDAVHTSFVTGVTVMDQNLVQFKLHPGTEVPGGHDWGIPPTVDKKDRKELLATFNSGFLMTDSMGGYWQNGKSVGQLREGAASMVFYKDGKMNVGTWGKDVRMTKDVVAVRQNLHLLVDRGQIAPEAQMDHTNAYGFTLGNAKYVWRSGIGIRKDGSIVEVCGNTLSVLTLATLLRDAGAVRAMTLDINPSWTSYITYKHGKDGKITAKKLTEDQVRDPYRHLEISTRDFVAVYQRPAQ